MKPEIPTPETVGSLQREALEPQVNAIVAAIIEKMKEGPAAYYSVDVHDYKAARLAAREFETKGWVAEVHNDQREGMFVQVRAAQRR